MAMGYEKDEVAMALSAIGTSASQEAVVEFCRRFANLKSMGFNEGARPRCPGLAWGRRHRSDRCMPCLSMNRCSFLCGNMPGLHEVSGACTSTH